MNNIDRSLTENLSVKTLITDLARSPADFKAAICEDDEMYLYSLDTTRADANLALMTYFTLGRSICNTVKQVTDWHFGDLGQVQSFLDFACGYGRFTRFLIQEIAPKKIWAADIYPNAVKFQREYLGVNGIDSTGKPENFSLEQSFDCILANSFFSHMPERTFTVWLRNLYQILNQHGVLMFSVHDEALLPAHVNMTPNGILFSADSESRSLDTQEYGTTYVTEAYVRACMANISQNQAVVYRIPKGICGFQDLYVVTKQPGKAFSELRFSHQPQGYVDAVARSPKGNLYLEGWAFDGNLTGEPVEVQIHVKGELGHCLAPFFKRQDVAQHFSQPTVALCGWYCFLPHKLTEDDVVLIKVLNKRGYTAVLVCADLRTLLATRVPQIDLATIRLRER